MRQASANRSLPFLDHGRNGKANMTTEYSPERESGNTVDRRSQNKETNREAFDLGVGDAVPVASPQLRHLRIYGHDHRRRSQTAMLASCPSRRGAVSSSNHSPPSAR